MTQEEERRRVARELHDGVNQQLAMLSLRLGVLAKRPPNDPKETSHQFEELKKSALGLSRDVREVSHRLHSSELEHLGLVQALRTECSRIERESGIKVDLDTGEAPESSSWDPSLCVYRVAQESLLNAVKHSGASRIRVRLRAADGEMELEVSDDGAGFDVEPTKRNAGLGLTSMAERVRYLGGRFQLTSRPGTGTEVRASLPIDGAVAKEESGEEKVSSRG